MDWLARATTKKRKVIYRKILCTKTPFTYSLWCKFWGKTNLSLPQSLWMQMFWQIQSIGTFFEIVSLKWVVLYIYYRNEFKFIHSAFELAAWFHDLPTSYPCRLFTPFPPTPKTFHPQLHQINKRNNNNNIKLERAPRWSLGTELENGTPPILPRRYIIFTTKSLKVK